MTEKNPFILERDNITLQEIMEKSDRLVDEVTEVCGKASHLLVMSMIFRLMEKSMAVLDIEDHNFPEETAVAKKGMEAYRTIVAGSCALAVGTKNYPKQCSSVIRNQLAKDKGGLGEAERSRLQQIASEMTKHVAEKEESEETFDDLLNNLFNES